MKPTLLFGAFLAALLIAAPLFALANPGDPIPGISVGLDHHPGDVVISKAQTNGAGVSYSQM
jgi:hypothetical protein